MIMYGRFLRLQTLEMRTLTAGVAVMATGSFAQSYGKLMALATLIHDSYFYCFSYWAEAICSIDYSFRG